MMRKSKMFLLLTAVNVLVLGLFGLHARHGRRVDGVALKERIELVRSLRLTDLCLFTEARYTRNPVMADRFAPFQDQPGALEHFPSGSLVSPPAWMRPGRLHHRPGGDIP